MSTAVHLAVDAQSGDYGPEVIVRGILLARKAASSPFITHLCGDKPEISHVLDDLEGEVSFDRSEFIVEHCSETISEKDKRTRVWKNRTDSSIIRCISLQKEGVVQASVSAGDSGVLIGASLFILGRSEGTLRPALAAFIPTPRRKPVLILDVGANLNCRAEHLVSFAHMGSSYVRRLFATEAPATALLNIGVESIKGPETVRDAAEELQNSQEGFRGFIEGNRVLSGDVDVVVCDGFVGNVLLKTCESFYSLASSVLSGSREILEFLSSKMEVLNPENYGAVPFLGINGTVLKAHGGSSSRAIRNAVLTALKAAENEAAGPSGYEKSER
ncbi:MAG: phosphate acyltransferase [Chitinispirillaceae bacterium]